MSFGTFNVPVPLATILQPSLTSATLINSPTSISIIEKRFIDPITGIWTLPTYQFTYEDPHPLNRDKDYVKSVIKHFKTRLIEKWLYNDPIFRKLLKFFRVKENKDGKGGQVTLISDIDHPEKTSTNIQHKKVIFDYICEFFINKEFVKKTLNKYVKTSKVNWFDLFTDSANLKQMFYVTLRRLIENTILKAQQ